MTKALADTSAFMRNKSVSDPALQQALLRAKSDGHINPQEIYQMMAAANTGTSSFLGHKFMRVWGANFAITEMFNRTLTFSAAYQLAKDAGSATAYEDAVFAVTETQGLYNKGNRPDWARGAVGSTLFTFKQYSISYVELLSRMANAGEPGSPERKAGQKAALLALAVLFLMSGADGIPFVEDVEDVIDAALQRMGYNTSTRQAREELFVSVLGQDGARFLQKGLSGLPGVPIDVSGRLGMGNLIPGTGVLLKKADHTRDVMELFGPAGDLAKRTFEAAGQLAAGDVVKAKVTISPVAARNVYQAMDMANTGMYRDAKGRKVIDTDGFDAAMKSIGFQPNVVARVQEATFQTQRMIGLAKITETEIADRWALGLFENDAGKVKAAREQLEDWNRTNPESPIRIGRPQINKRLKAMRMSKTERIEKTAPQEIRAQVRAELAGAR